MYLTRNRSNHGGRERARDHSIAEIAGVFRFAEERGEEDKTETYTPRFFPRILQHRQKKQIS